MEIPQECPFKGLCRIVSKPEQIDGLIREKAEGLYTDFDVLRTRHIDETGQCINKNDSGCWMTAKHQREFVEWFIDDDPNCDLD